MNPEDIAEGVRSMAEDEVPLQPEDRFPQELVEEQYVRVVTEQEQYGFLGAIGEVVTDSEAHIEEHTAEAKEVLQDCNIDIIDSYEEGSEDSGYFNRDGYVVHLADSLLEGFQWVFLQYARGVPLGFDVQTVSGEWSDDGYWFRPDDIIEMSNVDIRTGGGFDQIQVFVPYPEDPVWGEGYSHPEEPQFHREVYTRTELYSTILYLWSRYERGRIGVGTAEGPLTF